MTAPAAGKRRANRRRDDPPGTKPPPQESWFAAFGVGADTQMRESVWEAGDDPRQSPGWPAPGDARSTDSRFFTRQARRIVAPNADSSSYHRIYRLFVSARAMLGLTLLLAQAAGALLGTRSPAALLVVSGLYAAQALTMWAQPRFRTRRLGDVTTRLSRLQYLLTIVADVVAFSALHLLSPGNLNYMPLLVLPVLMAGVLTPRLVALATAAGVSLVLLGGAWRAAWAGGDVAALMTQAGMAGIGFFVITLLAGELAGRLAREELTARGSMELARQQAQLNRLVIEQMADGVLVIDRRARVRAANPAARRLLAAQGLAAAAPFALNGAPEWQALYETVAHAFDVGAWPVAEQDVLLQFPDAQTRTLRLRARFTGRRAQDGVGDSERRRQAEELCVLFLDDLRNVQARTRQEKLAAMGRVSAGIAHEIRNPLAAISQANALLQEDVLPPDQQRLTRIVADNAERLKRIVEDVLEVAPGGEPSEGRVDASAEVARIAIEWGRTVQMALGEGSRLRMRLPQAPLPVVFDAEHLRRVLVNLLDNARRHASETPGAIEIRLAAQGDMLALLSVASDSAPIPPDVERHLFEPFFSTRSRGTGLGLYICRELCERYGASMDYRLRPPDQTNRNEFQVIMRRATDGPPEVPSQS